MNLYSFGIGFLILALTFGSDLRAATPPNDNFANAQPLQNGVNVDGTLIGSSLEPGDYHSLDFDTNVWYTWTATQTGKAQISGVSRDGYYVGFTVLVYLGAEALTQAFITSGDVERGPIAFYALAGQTYHISVLRYPQVNFTIGLVADASLSQKTNFIYPNSNDDFDQAVISIKPNDKFVFYMGNASVEPFEADMLKRAGYNGSIGGSVWIKWTARSSGTAYFSAKTLYKKQLVLIAGKGKSIPTLKILGAALNGVSFKCKAGKTYRLYVMSTSDSQVNAKITIQ